MSELPGPYVGPGPQPILASFAHPTPLCYVSKISEKISGLNPLPNRESAGAVSNKSETVTNQIHSDRIFNL